MIRWPWMVIASAPAVPHRVDHGLDVLLVHDERVDVLAGGLADLARGVVEGDGEAGAGAPG